MTSHHEIQALLKQWLKRHFKKTTLLIKEEVHVKISDFRMSADIIAIQSKSNIIHGFEIKTNLNGDSTLSAIWQAYSYYTNYRWLVILAKSSDFISSSTINEQIESLGIGILCFDGNTFKVLKDAKYIDGNFLKYWPDLSEEWITTKSSKK